jgi:hypothetical protein
MTETIPTRPFDEMEALAWLRSQPEGAVTASAAELGRRWAGTGQDADRTPVEGVGESRFDSS